MPIPRNWSEELVWEWLSLRRYLTDVGVPTGTGGRGGRKEADVVGARIKKTGSGKSILEIYHVEIGSLAGALSSNAETVIKKFSQETMKSIKDRLTERLGLVGQTEYHKLYVWTWAKSAGAKKLEGQDNIKREQIKIWAMRDLCEEVLRAIREWKSAPGYPVKSHGKVTLPESYWLLNLVDYLEENQLLAATPAGGEIE